jgi:hypothetical protein
MGNINRSNILKIKPKMGERNRAIYGEHVYVSLELNSYRLEGGYGKL